MDFDCTRIIFAYSLLRKAAARDQQPEGAQLLGLSVAARTFHHNRLALNANSLPVATESSWEDKVIICESELHGKNA
jgi:hypothetical protein